MVIVEQQCLCSNCNRILSFKTQDIVRTSEGQTVIKCPLCGQYVNVRPDSSWRV